MSSLGNVGLRGSRRPPETELARLIGAAREALNVPPDRDWRITASRMKLKKILFEIEEQCPGGVRRMVGKVGGERGKTKPAYTALSLLWDAGFRPPHLYTVTEPYLYLEEHDLLLQEKAPGLPLIESVRSNAPGVLDKVVLAGRWLAELHASKIAVQPATAGSARYTRCVQELCETLQPQAGRITTIWEKALERMAAHADVPLVPGHGDYHPINIFVDQDRVTVIDFDTFAARDAAFDVAYFLTQTLIMGYLDSGTFESTEEARNAFLREYSRLRRDDEVAERLSHFMALTLIQSLHFELCILHTGNTSLIEPWLDCAERCLNIK